MQAHPRPGMTRINQTTAHPLRWLIWTPVLMVGALMFWTVALGLGGLSLLAVSAFSASDGDDDAGAALAAARDDGTAADPPRDGYEPILVHIEESTEPEDVDDNAGCGFTDELAKAAAGTVTAGPSDSGTHLSVPADGNL